MKYKVLTKVISLFLAILFIASSGAAFVFAADTSTSVPTFEDIEKTDVIADLTRMGIDYQKYPKDLDAEHVRLLYFLEYGYDYYKDNSDYALYLYVWNPTGKKINTVTGMNSIQMRVSATTNVDNDGEQFLKYKLEEVGASTSQGWENVFYKFKVLDAKGFLDTLNRDMRVYDISGIELQHQGNAKPKDYKVGGLYTFTGFQSYHGKDKKVANTLYADVVDRLVIDIELHPTSWLSEQSDKGKDYRYELFSVYFSVPNDIIEDYGNPENKEHRGLVEINGQYDKHRINGLLTDSVQMYNIVYPYLNKEISIYDSTVPFVFYANDAASAMLSTRWGFNYHGPIHSSNRVEKITSVLLISENFEKLTHSEILSQFETIWNDYGEEINYDDLAKRQGDDILYSIKSGNDLAYEIKNYASGNSWWDALWDMNFGQYNKPVNYEGAMSIQALNNDSFKIGSVNMTEEAISAEYFVHQSDVNSLKEFVSVEQFDDKTTYLMRLSVEDYVCVSVDVNSEFLDLDEGQYYYEKVVYTDIDVFSFTFENENSQRVTLPVVASPIDNAGVIEKPAEDNFNINKSDSNILELLMKLLALIAGLLVFVLLIFLISKITGISVTDIISWIIKIIRKFFVWIYGIIRKFVFWIRKQIKVISTGNKKYVKTSSSVKKKQIKPTSKGKKKE